MQAAKLVRVRSCANLYAQEVNHRDPVLVCRPKPLVVGGVRVIPHKGIVDRVVAFENLAVDFPLVVVSDPPARARKHSPDREQVTHAPRLEDPALRIHERDALVAEFEPGAQLLLREVIMHFAQEPDALKGGEAHQDVGVVGGHAVVLISGKDAWCASLPATAVSGLSRKKMLAFRYIWTCACPSPRPDGRKC